VRVIGVTSAHAAGATSQAAGLAGVIAGAERALLVDLNPDLAQLATLLDLDDSANVYHLAHRARLEPVSVAMLEEHVRWHEGLAAVLPGATDPSQAQLIRDHFVSGLLDAAAGAYSWVVIDVGRARPNLHPAAARGVLLWIVTPSPLGLAAFDRRFQQLRAAEVPWLRRVKVVVNQAADDSLLGVAEFLEREYAVPVLGNVPYEPGFWRGLELSHSLQAFSAEIRDESRYVSWFGRPALSTRRALEAIFARLEASLVNQETVGAEA
jgi:MinD-like ATPase involved in chromosome partitioning or flagellar assembly